MKKLIMFLTLMFSYSAFATIPETQIRSLGGDFQLTDQYNQPFNLKQLRGKIVMMFFGYTSCPQVCPTELSKMVSTLNALGDEADKVQAVFISIDPERDSVNTLNTYLKEFRANLIGLTGNTDEIKKVASQYSVNYKSMKKMGKNYHVQHKSDIFVLNDQGDLETIIPYGMPYAHVTRVVKNLLLEK